MNWIKVEDQLPETGRSRSNAVIGYGCTQLGSPSNTFEVMECYYTKDGYWEYGEFDCYVNVTHWIPLPDKPSN